MKNRYAGVRNEVLVQYFGIIIFLLAVSYVLIITNPPSDFLRYDNNLGRAVTKDNLTLGELRAYKGSLLIFVGLFALMTFFIGLSMSIVYDVEGESLRSGIILSMSFLLFPTMGFLAYPYYGSALTFTMLSTGYLTGILGFYSSKPVRAKSIPTISAITFLIGTVIIWYLFLFDKISALLALSIHAGLVVLLALAIITYELILLSRLLMRRRR